jgi:hypothetical protein
MKAGIMNIEKADTIATPTLHPLKNGRNCMDSD